LTKDIILANSKSITLSKEVFKDNMFLFCTMPYQNDDGFVDSKLNIEFFRMLGLGHEADQIKHFA